jgi:phage terminase large subunit-like protein
VLEGKLKDDGLFTIIYTLDDGDDWGDERNWVKANPNWGVSVYPRQLHQALTEAREFVHKEVEFKTKLLNVWTDTAMTWISDADWMACEQDMDLDGVECYAGLDLASTSDFCAFSLWFPEYYAVRTWYYLPEEAIRRRTDSVGQQYKQWQRDGWIIETPGNVTDYDYIRKHIGELCERYNVQDISYDRYNSSQLVIQLTNDGLSMYPFGQGFVSMSAPTKELERKVKNKELTHDGNPVTRWMMGNIYLKTDPAGNVKIDKAKSGDKVDGAVSMVMALGGYMAGAAESKQDFWFVQL